MPSKIVNTALALLVAASSLVAGCGSDTCSSSAATLELQSTSCTLAAGETATVTVHVCAKCTDSSPTCQAEFVSDHFEIAPVVQQCSEAAGCAVSGCSTTANAASCQLAVPASLSGVVEAFVVGADSTVTAQITVGSSGTSCTL